MASRIEKNDVFLRAYVAAVNDGYDFPCMSAFVDRYMLTEVPTSKIGNPKLLAQWGRDVLAIVQTFRKEAGDAPLPFPVIPDTHRLTPEERQQSRIDKLREKTRLQAIANRDASNEILSGLKVPVQGLFAEHPVTSQGDVPSV